MYWKDDSPARRVLEYLEENESITIKEARELCGCPTYMDARLLLLDLRQHGMLSSEFTARRGTRRFTKGRLFDQWRSWRGNDAMSHDRFSIQGSVKLSVRVPRH